MSRNGQKLPFNGLHDNKLIEICKNSVLMGEALVKADDDTLMKREDGNGYLNSDNVDVNKINFFLWNVIPYEDFVNKKSKKEYLINFNRLEQLVSDIDLENFQVIESRTCKNIDEVVNHFKENISNGLEGTIIKNTSTKWKDGTSKDMVKVKVVFDCDLEIVGYREGSGKNIGKLGAFQCKSSDSKLEVSIGGGYKQKQRETFWKDADKYIGKIITVKANDLISNDKDDSKMSLFLPRFVEIREDKQEADSLDRIKEQMQSSISALEVIE